MKIDNNKFSIFTICTENYKECALKTIPSWVKQNNVERIYVYTDFNLEYDSQKVIVLPIIEKTTDWIKIVGMKCKVLKNITKMTIENEKLAFIDIDCVIKDDISEVFENKFDIAVTRFSKKNTINSGVWFVINNDNVKKLAEEWENLQNIYFERKNGVKARYSSYSQKSLSEIVHQQYDNKTYLTVLPLSSRKYNHEADNEISWAKTVKRDNPKIIHFKGCKWKNEDLFNELMNF